MREEEGVRERESTRDVRKIKSIAPARLAVHVEIEFSFRHNLLLLSRRSGAANMFAS